MRKNQHANFDTDRLSNHPDYIFHFIFVLLFHGRKKDCVHTLQLVLEQDYSRLEVWFHYGLKIFFSVRYELDFFETDSCLLALTTSTSHMQSCFKIDLIFIKLSNISFLFLKARVFLVTIMKWRMSTQGYKHLTKF